MNQEELKPCPFCGDKVAINEFGIFCTFCNCCMLVKGWIEESKEQIIKAWNRRTGETK